VNSIFFVEHMKAVERFHWLFGQCVFPVDLHEQADRVRESFSGFSHQAFTEACRAGVLGTWKPEGGKDAG